MELRSYQTVEDIDGKFDELVVGMRRRGQIMLPGERELCELLGCSRNTARKLLEHKLSEGVIVRKARGRALSHDTVTGGKTLGRVTFVAKGSVIVENPAWNRLWHRFQVKAEAAGIVTETALIPFHREDFDQEAFTAQLSGVLVVTTINPEDLQRLLGRKNQLLVTTEEHLADAIPNVVAMDNYAAGAMAAEELFRHGYRKPAYITDLREDDGRAYVPYVKRLAGFRDACQRLGMDYNQESEFMVEWRSGARNCLDIARYAACAARSSFDSIFLHTDVNFDFLLEGLRDAGKETPRDLGVITINSYGRAESHHQKISSVSHGTESVADALVDKLIRFFETGDTQMGECLVRPSIHPGNTLK